MNKIGFSKFSLCMFLSYMFCFGCMKKVNALMPNYNKEAIQILKTRENSFFYTNIQSSDNNYVLRGYTCVKNDTLYFLKIKNNMKNYEKFPICLIEKRSKINSNFSYIFKDIGQNRSYTSELIHSTFFGNEYFYFFKNYVNVCDLHIANCTKSGSELMIANRTAFFIYSSKRGIIYFDFHLVIGGHLPYLS